MAAVSVVALASAAWADEKPAYGPAAAWVQVAEVPPPPGDDQAPALQAVLDDSQALLGKDGLYSYNRRIVRVTKPEGLASGSRTITWQPDRDKVTLHGLAIIRDGQRIDLLKNGEDVLVLRREKDLERAMLDGRMTATIQIKDLRVGDMVDWSASVERRDPILGPRVSDFERMGWPGAIGRYRVRMLWADGTPLVWKATAGFPDPKIGKADGLNELVVDEMGAIAPKPPTGAPLRFQRVGEIQATTYRGWEDVVAPMAPLYAEAMTLKPDSPLKAEIAAIAAASPDPKVRAFNALKLVEDKTRYLLLAMGDGGYKPASADETWARRFGDCKGKTVLLIAILKGLNIQAEPVVVFASPAADGLDQRVPSASQFNHVLVRATIDGKAYWLDGTRSGDRGGLQTLAAPPFLWGLPIKASGATLEPIVQQTPTRPEMDTTMRFDASAGLDKPAKSTVIMTMRGDTARAMARVIENAPRADIERSFRQSFSSTNSWLKIATFDWSVADDGAVTLTIAGDADMEWRLNDDVGLMEWRLPVSGTGKAAQFPRREPGPNADAPFATPFPAFKKALIEVTLPNGGAGFTIKGPVYSGRIANADVTRVAQMHDGKATFFESEQSVARELPFDQAEEANKVRRRLAEQALIIRAPKGS
jgi:transglutaminase-like putative cysteine protease